MDNDVFVRKMRGYDEHFEEVEERILPETVAAADQAEFEKLLTRFGPVLCQVIHARHRTKSVVSVLSELAFSPGSQQEEGPLQSAWEGADIAHSSLLETEQEFVVSLLIQAAPGLPKATHQPSFREQ